MVERNHQQLEQIMKINVAADKPQWYRVVNIVVKAQSMTYRHSSKCTEIECFLGGIPYNTLVFVFRNQLQTNCGKVIFWSLIIEVNKKYK